MFLLLLAFYLFAGDAAEEKRQVDCMVSPRRSTLNGFKCPGTLHPDKWNKRMVEKMAER
jgi:hypothetical protein